MVDVLELEVDGDGGEHDEASARDEDRLYVLRGQGEQSGKSEEIGSKASPFWSIRAEAPKQKEESKSTRQHHKRQQNGTGTQERC